MEHIIETLVAAGYFRARISSLSDFDKIIGGMAWAMQVFSYDLNIDVFYADSLDLGQKIALTERLVMVLLATRCPYRIEPHQIVGLDYANLVPVVKWLIRRSAEVRREQEAFNRLLALRHYHRISGQQPDRAAWCHVVPVRHLERLKASKLEASSVVCEALLEDEDGPTAAEERATADLLARINEEFKQNQQVSFVQLTNLMRAAGSQPVSDQRRRQQQQQEQASPASKSATEEGHSDESDESDESEEATGCGGGDSPALATLRPSNEPAKLVEGALEEGQEARLVRQELDNELLATSQKILNLLKKVDSMPSQLEICQYQRRYIELHQQLISKNKDVKKLFDLYNTLDVTKHYLVKEITLLDSISANLDLTNNSPANRELFLRQFNEIIRKIQDIRRDMQARLARLRQKCELLNSEYAANLHELELEP